MFKTYRNEWNLTLDNKSNDRKFYVLVNFTRNRLGI